MRRPFDRPVPPGGYDWSYLDGLSDDGAWAIVVIALVGSPFSTAYARAMHADQHADPLRFSQVNVALYGPRGSRWVLTERPIPGHARSRDGIALRRTTMGWVGDALVVDVDEVSPWTRRPIRGRIELTPDSRYDQVLALDRGRRHHWWPVAPRGRLEVNLQEPRVRFRGLGYHDANAGDEPLHAAFDRWSWSRGHAPARRTVITYGVREHDGSSTVRALSLQDQTMRSVEGVHLHALPRSRWGLEREVWTPSASTPRLLRSLESGPFYGRDVLEVDSGGSVIRMVSEMLSARRLASRTARFMTGFRARREPC